MANLVDFLSAYRGREAQMQAQPMQELQQVGALQGIMANVQKQQMAQKAMQEEEQMRAVVQQGGGNPAATIEKLLATGHPKAIELAAKLKGLIAKPDTGHAIGSGGFLKPDGTVVPPAARPDTTVKAPQTRTRIDGNNQVQEEFNTATKTWTPIGSGPRFARQVAPAGGAGGYAAQGVFDPVKDKAELRDLAVQSLYDPGSLAGFRKDTKTMAAIQRERIRVMGEAGVTSEDVVSGRAGFKADTASLNKITTQYDAITSFEKTAIRNGKILIELADKVDTTGIPVVERWIRAGKKELAGDPDVAKFHAQMNLYRAEAARILTQPNLSGILTDTARKEMEEVMSNKATAQQIRETVNLLERDFLNRKETLEEQISAIRARMRSRVAPGGEPKAAAAPTPPVAPGAIPEFATEEDAIKAGVKGKVKIGGRNATIQ